MAERQLHSLDTGDMHHRARPLFLHNVLGLRHDDIIVVLDRVPFEEMAEFWSVFYAPNIYLLLRLSVVLGLFLRHQVRA